MAVATTTRPARLFPVFRLFRVFHLFQTHCHAIRNTRQPTTLPSRPVLP